MNAQQVSTANYNELTKYAHTLGIKYVGIKKEILRQNILDAIATQEKPAFTECKDFSEATSEKHSLPMWDDTWGFDCALVYPEGVELYLDVETGFYAIVEGLACELACQYRQRKQLLHERWENTSIAVKFHQTLTPEALELATAIGREGEFCLIQADLYFTQNEITWLTEISGLAEKRLIGRDDRQKLYLQLSEYGKRVLFAVVSTEIVEADTQEQAESNDNYVDAVGNPIRIEGDLAVIYSRKNGNKLKDMPLSQFEMTKKWLQTEEQWQAANAAKETSSKQEKKSVKRNDRKQSTFEMVKALAEVAIAQGYDVAAKQFDKPVAYCKRATRAYRELYCQSEVIKNLFDSNKISWGVIHKLGGHNPAKMGLQAIEQKAMTLAG